MEIGFDTGSQLNLTGGSGAAYTINGDTSLSRLAAKSFGMGDNTVGNTDGTLTLTTLNALGTLFSGKVGGASGNLSLKGLTSGTATIIAPAVAGTTTNPILISNVISLPGVVLKAVAPTVAAAQVGLGSTTAATATAGGGQAALATVLGYLVANVAGVTVKIPYYSN